MRTIDVRIWQDHEPTQACSAPRGGVMDYEWQFREGRPTGWDWVCIDRKTSTVIKVSDRTFLQMHDCVEDAKRHGFTPSPIGLPDAGPKE